MWRVGGLRLRRRGGFSCCGEGGLARAECSSMCGLCCHGVECRRDHLLVGLGGQILLELRGRRRRRVCTGGLRVSGCVRVREVGTANLSA